MVVDLMVAFLLWDGGILGVRRAARLDRHQLPQALRHLAATAVGTRDALRPLSALRQIEPCTAHDKRPMYVRPRLSRCNASNRTERQEREHFPP